MIKKKRFVGFTIFIVGVVLALTISEFYFTPRNTIVKSPNDDREFKYIKLENGMEGVVFQDDQRESATISIAVNAGSLDNPREIPGLAHFVEHLLFLGTEEYPEVNFLQKFLAQHDGYYNAYTSGDNTVYFLEVKSEALEEAMKILSRFFVTPLFKEEFVSRELNAVHSEHSKNIRQDGRIFFEVLGDIYHSNHPASFFFTGNRETLNRPGIREKVMEYYEKYYGAKNIAFSIQGGKEQSIEDLEELAEKWLEDIPERAGVPESRAALEGKLFRDDVSLPLEIDIKTIDKMESLTLIFLTSPDSYEQANEYYHHPPYGSAYFVSRLLNCTLPGCLAYELKEKGWVNSMEGSYGFDRYFQTYLLVGFDLTELGKTKQDEITKAFFSYLKLLRSENPEKWRYQEIELLRKIDFDFQQKGSAIGLANHLASTLHKDVPVEKLLTFHVVPEEFKPDEIRKLLSIVDPKKMLKVYRSKGVLGGRINKWYKTPYSWKKVSPEKLDSWTNISKSSGELSFTENFALPTRNEYLPEYPKFLENNLGSGDVEDGDGGGDKRGMVRIQSNRQMEVWYRNEISFKDPQVIIDLNFELPALNSPTAQNYQNIYLSYLNDQIRQDFFYLFDIGSSVSLRNSIKGVNLKVVTYAGNIEKVFTQLEDIFFRLELLESKYEIYLEKLGRSYQNLQEIRPLQRIYKNMQYLNESFVHHEDDLIESYNALTFAGFKEFYQNFFKKSRLGVLVYGNTYREQVDAIISILQDRFLTPGQSRGVSGLEEGEKITIDYLKIEPIRAIQNNEAAKSVVVGTSKSEDHAFVRIYQGDRSIQTRAGFEILQKVLGEQYYEIIRTRKQIGYIVYANVNGNSHNNRMMFVVQSPFKTSEEIAQETDRFFRDMQAQIKQLDEEKFERMKRSIIQGYLEPDKNLNESFARFSRALAIEDYSFQLNNPIIQALEDLTLVKVKEIFKTTLIDQPKFLEFWTLPRSKWSDDSENDVASKMNVNRKLRKRLQKTFRNIDPILDLSAYKSTQPRLPHISGAVANPLN